MRYHVRSVAWLGVLAVPLLLPSDASSGRFGGGGFHGGGFSGGGFHPQGGGGGGFRSGGSPMFQPAQRPGFQQAASRAGSVHGPFDGGFANRAQNISRPGAGDAGERHAWQTPGGGTIWRGGKTGSFTGPGGGSISGGKGGWAYTGPHGSVAIHGGKAGEITGPGGREIAGGKSGTAVIGPNGNIHASGTKGGAVVGPNGAAIAREHGGVTAGPGGVVAHGGRAGAAVGPEGAIAGGSRGGVAVGPGGAIAGRSRGAVAVGPYGAVAAGGRYVAGRSTYGTGIIGTHFVAASDLRGQGVYVRNGFRYYNAFTHAWYRRYPGAWFAGGWVAGSAWTAASWATCASYIGYPAEVSPVYYNFGDNVTYQDDSVYYGDQVYATQDEYAQQAAQIADSGREPKPSEDEKWQPLGVFAMVKGDETTSNDIFQLALNKDGVLRGNYYNAASDSTQPVYGSLDKKTQRVAWTIGDKKDLVYETGLYNLTKDEATMLVHHGKDSTEQYKLFRVQQQDEKKEGEK